MKKRFGGVVLDVSSRLIVTFSMVYAIYVLVFGEFGPGGGFQAGVIEAVVEDEGHQAAEENEADGALHRSKAGLIPDSGKAADHNAGDKKADAGKQQNVGGAADAVGGKAQLHCGE